MVKNPYTWNKDWILRFESFYSVIEKFKFNNCIDGKDFVHLLNKTTISSNINSLLETVSEEEIQYIFDFPIKQRNDEIVDSLIKPLKVKNEKNNKFFAKNFRYCPVCMNQYHHSVLHQFLLFKYCPFHNIPLQENCPGCNKKIKYDLYNNNPYFCQCGYCFVKDIYNYGSFLTTMNQINEFYRDIENKNQSFAHYISLKDVLIYIDERVIIEKTYNSDLIDEIFKLHVDSKNKNFMKLFYKTKDYTTVSLQPKRDYKKLFLGTKSIYKSIARHIRKKVLKRHQRCIRSMVKLKLEVYSCKQAMSYIFWRMIVENLSSFTLVDNGVQKGDTRYNNSVSFVSKIDHEELERLYNYLAINFPNKDKIVHNIINKYMAILLWQRYKLIDKFFESSQKLDSFHFEIIDFINQNTRVLFLYETDSNYSIARFALIQDM